MMSKIPVGLGKLGKDKLDVEIMRVAMMAELDAIDLYEQLAAQTDDIGMRKVLLDVAREEKAHFGEFQTVLLGIDKEQVAELEKAKGEVHQLIKK